MDQLSWNTDNRDIRNAEYTQSTAALDVAEEQEAVLASEAAEVAEITKEGADEPITEVILLTVSMLQIRIAISQRKSGKP
jgi:hypothetical protein